MKTYYNMFPPVEDLPYHRTRSDSGFFWFCGSSGQTPQIVEIVQYYNETHTCLFVTGNFDVYTLEKTFEEEGNFFLFGPIEVPEEVKICETTLKKNGETSDLTT